ncbi:IS3 family transposase [Porcipelethomonas ammoniilytica]
MICDYIDFYNNRRPHATINYKAPNQYEGFPNKKLIPSGFKG